MKRIALVVLAAFASPYSSSAAQSPAPVPPGKKTALSKAIYSGIFSESARESIFYPCGGAPGTSGLWLKFLPGVKAGQARYQYPRNGDGMPTSNHFVVVRGTLSQPGSFGYGFQLRQLVVDSVLDIRDPQECPSAFNAAPRPWDGIGFVGRTVSAVASTRDGHLTAIAINKGTVSVWDNTSGRKITDYRFMPPADPSSVPSMSLAFSTSGDLLAIGGPDGWITVVKIPSGKTLWKLSHATQQRDSVETPGHGWWIFGPSSVESLAFTSDDKILVSAGAGRAYTWSMLTGERLNKLLGTGINRVVAPSYVLTTENPPRIIGYAANGSINVYSVDGGVPFFTAGGPATGWQAGPIKMSRDERFMAIGESHDTVSLWSMTEGKVIHRFGVPPFGHGDFAFSPDGEKLAIPGGAFSVYVWSTSSGAPIAQLRSPHAGAFRLWFTPNGDSVVMSTFFDSTLVVSALPTGNSATRDKIFSAAKRPSAKTAFLFGSVTDSGSPIRSALVEVSADSLHQTRLGWTQSDSDGLFAIDSLSPGTFYLRVRRIGFEMVVKKLELVAGMNSVGVAMPYGHGQVVSVR